MIMDSFKTIAQNGEALIIEKKSKFIATVYQVQTVEEADLYMQQLRKSITMPRITALLIK